MVEIREFVYQAPQEVFIMFLKCVSLYVTISRTFYRTFVMYERGEIQEFNYLSLVGCCLTVPLAPPFVWYPYQQQ